MVKLQEQFRKNEVTTKLFVNSPADNLQQSGIIPVISRLSPLRRKNICRFGNGIQSFNTSSVYLGGRIRTGAIMKLSFAA